MKKTLLTIMTAGSCMLASAQQDPMITQYMSNQLFINPAYAGSHDYPSLSGLYRKQWVDFQGAPTTSFLTYDVRPSCTNYGIGLTFVHDDINVSHRTDLSGLFAYHIPMANGGHLSIGIKGSLGYYNADLTEVKIWDQRDLVFAQNVMNRWIPNAGAGIYYYVPNFYAGISVPSLINYSRPSALVASEITSIPNYQRHYFLTSGYVIALNNDVYIKPSTLLKYTKDAPLEADFNLNVFFLNRINIGGGYRTNDGLVAMVEIYVMPNLRLGYAYDYPLTDINMFSTGSHELMVAYDFKHDFTKVKTPRFF